MTTKKSSPSKEDLITKVLDINNAEPWPTPVDGDALLDDIVAVICKYVVLDPCYAIAMALWIIHTYHNSAFLRSPLLLINAPEKACGKSVALGLVAKLVPRPLECANITVAALFRIVQNRHPTVLIDEADTFLEGKTEMAGILNKGYEKGGLVLRVETIGTSLKEVAYSVFGPKALAGISLERYLPDATLSRGIQIAMRRKIKGETVQRLRSIDPLMLGNLRSRIRRFSADNLSQLKEGYSAMPEQLSDREQDNWEPLFTIAKCASQRWLEKAIEAALAMKAATDEPQSMSNNLLVDIRAVLSQYQAIYITTAQLLDKLTEDSEMGWSTYNRGAPFSARQLAKNLSSYGIKPKTVRVSATSTPKGYEVREFEDAFSRYLQPLDPCLAGLPTDPLQASPVVPMFAEDTRFPDLQDF